MTAEADTSEAALGAAGPGPRPADAPFPAAAAGPDVLVVDHSSRLAGAELILIDAVRAFGPGSVAFLFEDGPLRPALAARGLGIVMSKRATAFDSVKRDVSLARALPHLAGLAAVTAEIARAARRHALVYANSQKAFVLAAPAAALARRPLVWHLHDIISERHFAPAQRRLVVALANRFAARVIVPSPAAADGFTAAGGRPALVHVVVNGLDVPPEAASVAELRAALGLPDGFLFGVFSRLAPWKGQHVALEALARLPGAHCLIVGAALFGEDAYAQSLHDTAARLGVADRVLFLGHRGDVPRLMRAVDAVVHPSVNPEPFGRTLVEAMLCRTPVIATAEGAAPEILEDGAAGLLAPPNDAGALADALSGIRDQGPAAAMLDRAERRAKALYGQDRMVAAIRDVVTPLAKARHG